MRLEAENHFQVSPHGEVLTRGGDSKAAKHLPSREAPAALTQKTKVKRSAGPKITGYENTDCGGTVLGQYMLPAGADFRVDHCLEVKDPESGLSNGRMKISCDSSGVAQVCVFKDANDTSCALAEPFCLNVLAEDTQMIAEGGCVPVKEHPKEKDSFARFTDFPEDTLWPDCMLPPMSQSLMLLVIIAGAVAGSLVLCGIWYSFFALPSPKHMDGPGKGYGKGGGWGGEGWGEGPPMGEGKGEMKGKGFGGPPPGKGKPGW
jgi:hypothetical protein